FQRWASDCGRCWGPLRQDPVAGGRQGGMRVLEGAPLRGAQRPNGERLPEFLPTAGATVHAAYLIAAAFFTNRSSQVLAGSTVAAAISLSNCLRKSSERFRLSALTSPSRE